MSWGEAISQIQTSIVHWSPTPPITGLRCHRIDSWLHWVAQKGFQDGVLPSTAVSFNKENYKMKQQKEPNAPHQVINTIQAPMENMSLRDEYNTRLRQLLALSTLSAGSLPSSSKLLAWSPTTASPLELESGPLSSSSSLEVWPSEGHKAGTST